MHHILAVYGKYESFSNQVLREIGVPCFLGILSVSLAFLREDNGVTPLVGASSAF